MLFLDYNTPCGTGLDVARHLAATKFRGRCVVHSSNGLGSFVMKQVLLKPAITVVVAGTFALNEAEPEPYNLGEVN